jgi:hypothetical protein
LKTTSFVASISVLIVSTVASTEPTPTPEWTTPNLADHQKAIADFSVAYRQTNKDSSMMFDRLQAAIAPGAVGGLALKGYFLTNKSEHDLKKIVKTALSEKVWLEEHIADPAAGKTTKFVRKTPMKGVFLVIAIFDGMVTAYNVVDPGQIPIL